MVAVSAWRRRENEDPRAALGPCREEGIGKGGERVLSAEEAIANPRQGVGPGAVSCFPSRRGLREQPGEIQALRAL